ncbi:hypothetical protein NDU88_002214 [Pleurodeles waltl]|uniref:Uncharacterized protein n=1 Tax=Pleurodeles waltl TaxID=8319 RepID=A0AAV7WNT2_PLEWA|nr:hypothetical protein NDU88_002214 [Pleurodeles waltl]
MLDLDGPAGERRSTRNRGAEGSGAGEGMAKPDGDKKEKRKRAAEWTSRGPRGCNANPPATLQEKRGNLRCVQVTNKGAQEGLGGREEKGTQTKRDWEGGRRREQEPRGSGRSGKEGKRESKRKTYTRQIPRQKKIPSSEKRLKIGTPS